MRHLRGSLIYGRSCLLSNYSVPIRYEVGRFFGAVERLKRAAEEQNNREAQKAFAAMSVAYDRYLKVGVMLPSYIGMSGPSPVC